MAVLKSIGKFFKEIFIEVYTHSNFYLVFIVVVISITAFIIVVKFGSEWHLFGLIGALIIFFFYWRPFKKQ